MCYVDIAERVREKEQKLAFHASLLSSVHDAIIAVGMDMKITYWNDTAVDLTGWRAEEIIGLPIKDFYRMVGIDAGWDQLEKNFATEGSLLVELTAHKKDGSPFCTDAHAKPIFGPDGERTGVVATFRDITDRKRAEEALRESERRYQELVQYAPAGIYEVDFRNGRFLSVNDTMCRISGYNRDELLRMSPFDLLDEPSRMKFQERISQWLSGEEPDKNVDFTVIAKDGREICAEFNVSFTRDENGLPMGATGIAFDITERKKMEEALKISESNFRTIFERSQIGIAVGDTEGRVVHSNPAFERMLGYGREELRGKAFTDLMHPGDLNIVKPLIHDLIDGKEDHCEIQKRYIRKDGQIIWVKLIGTVMLGGNGEKLCLTMVEDISESKSRESISAFIGNVEEELGRSRSSAGLMAAVGEMLKRRFNVARVTFYDIDEPSDTMNGICDIHDRGLASALGIRRISDYVREGLLKEQRNGRVVASDDIAADPRFTGLAGAYSAGGIRSEMVAPFAGDGKLRFVIAVQHGEPRMWRKYETDLLEEITSRLYPQIERKRSEEALRESEERLQEELEGTKLLQSISTELIFEDNAQAIYEMLLDTALKIMKSEYASLQILENKAGEAIGLHLLASRGFGCEAAEFWEWVSVSASTACGEALRSGRRVIVPDIERCNYMQGTEDLQRFLQIGVHSCQSTPLISHSGKIVGMISTQWRGCHEPSERQLLCFDVLARQAADFIERMKIDVELRASEAQARMLAEALEKKNRLVTDFFINISHEFKTPLTILMLGLELLETKAKRMRDGGAEIEKNILAMKQNSYRLNKLVANLLDITKLDAGFMEPKWEVSGIVGLLGGLVKSVEPYARQKGLALSLTCKGKPIHFITDGFMLERIVLNLLSNAIKHTKPGGRITVGCSATEAGIKLSVKDTGEGIPEDKRAVIFDRFSQVDTRMTRASEGTGIGLALTKSLAELLGGGISCVSELGRGSEFIVELPSLRRETQKIGREQGGMELDKRVQMELSDIN